MVRSKADINQLTILAPGLIGGSLGQCIKQNGFARAVVGWGRSEASLKAALALSAIDHYSLDLAEAIDGADMIVIATPTCVTETLLQQLAPIVSTDTIITDVASVKGNVLRAAKAAFGVLPANLVLGHPIAGSEQRGVTAAKAALFNNHYVVLTPTDETSPHALRRVTQLWESTGALITILSADRHDEYLAASSHFPHLLAFTFIDALSGNARHPDVFRFAAGGFRDFTRIAASDPVLWQEIMLANDKPILKAIDLFSERLAQLRSAIESGDKTTIVDCFQHAKKVRDALFTDNLNHCEKVHDGGKLLNQGTGTK